MADGSGREAVLAARRAGGLSAPVALLRLLALQPEPTPLLRWLDGGDATMRELAALARADLAGLERTAAVLREAADGHGGDVAACARMFDRAAARSPEAAVAAYSLGDPARLARATAEVVGLLDGLGVLRPGARLLDLGCGIGRVALAVAPRVGEVVAVDVSAAMLDEARRRCAGAPNVRLERASGGDLAGFPAASLDAVVAVDTWPYLVAAGVAEAVGTEAARVLRPGGDLVVLNWSYRGDLARDREDAARLARGGGFALLRDGTADLALWDGRTFHLRRHR